MNGQAGQLREAIASKLADLADELLGRPEFASKEWTERQKQLRNDEEATAKWHREWHLAKIAISRDADIDPTGDVINAKKHGATWADIGNAWGVSRQRAQERWGQYV